MSASFGMEGVVGSTRRVLSRAEADRLDLCRVCSIQRSAPKTHRQAALRSTDRFNASRACVCGRVVVVMVVVGGKQEQRWWCGGEGVRWLACSARQCIARLRAFAANNNNAHGQASQCVGRHWGQQAARSFLARSGALWPLGPGWLGLVGWGPKGVGGRRSVCIMCGCVGSID